MYLMRMEAAQSIQLKSIKFLKSLVWIRETPSFWASSTVLKKRINPLDSMSLLTQLPQELEKPRLGTALKESSLYSTRMRTELLILKSSRELLNSFTMPPTMTILLKCSTAPTLTTKPHPMKASLLMSSTRSFPSSTINDHPNPFIMQYICYLKHFNLD